MVQILLAGPADSGPESCADASAALSSREEEYLVSLVEVARPIIRRHQLFLWVRGVLQSLVPHDMLICAYGDWRRRAITVDYFAARPFPERALGELCDVDDGLLVQANALWDKSGHAPLLVSNLATDSDACMPLGAILRRHRIANCALHGIPQLNGGQSAFYCFAGLPEPLGRRASYLIELIMPSLYAAHLRVMHGEKHRDQRKSVPEPARQRVTALPRAITQREVQILQWVQEGKSNREIAEVLKLSPLTVKNHVQNILKKLKVRNRAQAVSRAINSRLIQSAGVTKSHVVMARTAHSDSDA